jgi:DNA ligase-1
VRSVRPTMVFEIGFEGIALSTRHKAGIAVRFPRILRKRDDKTVDDADSLDTLKGLLAAAGPALAGPSSGSPEALEDAA